MKTCSKCKVPKDEAEFNRASQPCKDCRKKYNSEYWTKNREELAAKNKIWRAENREELAAKKAAYQKENREEIAAYLKIYNAKNREELAAKAKIYCANNREKLTAYRKENREKTAARQRVSRYGVTPDDLKRMLAEQGGRCAICEKETKLCVDHDHETGKVRGLLCGFCNRAIGQLKDSSVIAQLATNYLKQHGK